MNISNEEIFLGSALILIILCMHMYMYIIAKRKCKMPIGYGYERQDITYCRDICNDYVH